jgi:hydroxymethylbilane synthase
MVPLTTRGDRILDQDLSKFGGKGLFIKELETAMQAGDADVAVHSMKDVPTRMPDGFCIAALLERANPFDALVSNKACSMAELADGAVVGSSSLRRQAQLKALRPELIVRSLRGNVNTRLKYLDRGDYAAIVLASAGLERLGLGHRISEQFSPDRMLPAAAQGVIGIECLADRGDLRALLARLEHAVTKQTTLAERAVARSLDAGCEAPLASYAVARDGLMTLKAMVASVDGRILLRREISGRADDAEKLGGELARQLLELGAAEVLRGTEA